MELCELKNKFDSIFKQNDGGRNVYRQELDIFTNELIKYIKKQTFKLYKYTKFDAYSLYAIKSEDVYLSKAGEMNDVFEGIQISEDGLDENSDLSVLSDFCRMSCFSEKRDSPYMWGNYADKGKGICIEYNLSWCKDDKDIFNYLYPVLYRNERFYGDYNIKTLIDEYKKADKRKEENLVEFSEYKALYMVKSSEWEQEKEWRFIKDCLDILDSESEYIHMPCISAVYIGYNLKDDCIISVLREIIENKNKTRDSEKRIKLCSTKMSDKNYLIEEDKRIL